MQLNAEAQESLKTQHNIKSLQMSLIRSIYLKNEIISVNVSKTEN